MTKVIDKLRSDMKKAANPEKGDFMQKFFSVEDRARGDIFCGLTVPQSRVIAKTYRDLEFLDIEGILTSEIHEERLIALFILVDQFVKGDAKKRSEIYKFYLKNTVFINHWDLVDSSAHKIVGKYLEGKPKGILIKLANSKIWWERRIAMIATFQFLIDEKDFGETLKIATILINDKHDLIQKAVGWMLREGGKKVSEKELTEFLAIHYKQMPRTMLRYSIEKFDEVTRKEYLTGEI